MINQGQVIFTTKKNQVAVQGFQPNRSYTKDETDKKFVEGVNVRKITFSTTAPANPQLGDLWVKPA